jgi:hypothetical protein
MMRRLGLLLVLPLLIGLAACSPTRTVSLPSKPHPVVSHKPVVTAAPQATVTPTAAPVAPPAIDAANYLVDGTPNVPDADGEWFGQWAFFTDSTKSVWCQFIVFSGDNPGATCSIVPSARAQATYPKPVVGGCEAVNADGYTLGMGGNADDLQPNADAGWDGCIAGDSDIAALMAKTKVLPNLATIAVSPFSCTVNAGVGTCVESLVGEPAIGITLGLHTASFHSTS